MLEVDVKTTIKTLYQKRYNKTQIGRMLDIDRKTVRKVLKEAETQTQAPEAETAAAAPKTGWPSMLDKYHEYIEIQLAKDLSITHIHQDLQKEYGVECGYMYVSITLDQSVQTFIRCHTEAFRYIGGVPQTVKIDNLKAVIVEADFYEPTV